MNREHVAISLAGHQALKDRLLRDFPDADEETLADTLEGLSDLPDILAAVVRSALDDEAMIAGLRGRLGDLKDRLARLEARRTQKRALVAEAMAEAGLTKLAEADFTASLRPVPPKVIVTDEAVVPGDYRKPQPDKIDVAGLSAALKAGRAIPGAGLSNPGSALSVRVR